MASTREPGATAASLSAFTGYAHARTNFRSRRAPILLGAPHCNPFCVSLTARAGLPPWLVKYKLEAWPSVLVLSVMMTLVPPVSFRVITVPGLGLAIMQPDVLAPRQSAVSPRKKKSVPPTPIFGLKNSEIGEQRERAEVSSCV